MQFTYRPTCTCTPAFCYPVNEIYLNRCFTSASSQSVSLWRAHLVFITGSRARSERSMELVYTTAAIDGSNQIAGRSVAAAGFSACRVTPSRSGPRDREGDRRTERDIESLERTRNNSLTLAANCGRRSTDKRTDGLQTERRTDGHASDTEWRNEQRSNRHTNTCSEWAAQAHDGCSETFYQRKRQPT